jgi:hypothetical protein
MTVTPIVTPICAAPGCTNHLSAPGPGRPPRYCSTACRVRAHRQRQREAAQPVTVEVDRGSASSRGRHPDRAWMVGLRRGDQSVVVAIGLGRVGAEHLAQSITRLLRPDQADPD